MYVGGVSRQYRQVVNVGRVFIKPQIYLLAAVVLFGHELALLERDPLLPENRSKMKVKVK